MAEIVSFTHSGSSSELFEKLHPKSRSLFARAFKKRKKSEGESSAELEEKEKLKNEFEKARWSEMAAMMEADSMQARIDPIKAQVGGVTPLAPSYRS